MKIIIVCGTYEELRKNIMEDTEPFPCDLSDDDFIKLLTLVLEEMNQSTDKMDIRKLIDKVFPIACDKIDGMAVDFISRKKCFNCGSARFEGRLVKPETVELIDLSVITHEEWIKMSDVAKRENIAATIKKFM